LAAGAAALAVEPEETIQLDSFLSSIERELIDRALVKAKGNKARAARLLGLNRARLLRRLAALARIEESAVRDDPEDLGLTDGQSPPSGSEGVS
jgi:DNA-binding NtrC family response regulator